MPSTLLSCSMHVCTESAWHHYLLVTMFTRLSELACSQLTINFDHRSLSFSANSHRVDARTRSRTHCCILNGMISGISLLWQRFYDDTNCCEASTVLWWSMANIVLDAQLSIRLMSASGCSKFLLTRQRPFELFRFRHRCSIYETGSRIDTDDAAWKNGVGKGGQISIYLCMC